MSDPYSQSQILTWDDDALVRQVGRALIDSGLGDEMSLFSPGQPVWSADTVGELYELYNEHLDYGSGTFLGKLRGQIGHGSDEVKLLTAELLTLHALPLFNLKATTKRERIGEILSWMSEPVPLPAEVSAAFEQYSWNGGHGAHSMIWKWLADAASFVRSWWDLPEAERVQALDDPWKWLTVIHATPGMPMLRGTLLYLAFPHYFLPIISLADKKAIRNAYSYRLDHDPGDLDRDLYEITLSIQHDVGRFHFYDHPYIDEWRPGAEEYTEKRAWLIRPRPGNADLVNRWMSENCVTVLADHLGSIEPGAGFPVVRAAVETGYQHEDYAQRVALATDYWTFISKIKPGDFVATETDGLIWVGTIGPGDVFAQAGRLRRPVSWQDADPAPVSALSEDFGTALEQQGTVVDITGALDAVAQILGEDSPLAEAPGASEDAEPATLHLRAITTEFAQRVHMPRLWLQELVDVLAGRRQVVLYGPPGTGKTFLAQEIAHHIAAPEAVRLIQFHPAYSYEDFFEGYRPVEKRDGTVGFALKPGPLRNMATEAARSPGRPHVLIIDEINRANLAKVFGELYFLLEYRRKSIELQYSPGQFSLPRNVFIIGTMNTADRSVAQFDAALRRRFAFIELHPDEPPVRDVLTEWAGNADSNDRPALLRALNEAMGEEDRDFKIGPAYLMRDEAATPEGLERIWQYDLLPLLEEHYYGRLGRSQVRQRFGLQAVRTRASRKGARIAEDIGS
jgi:5-methylcytosine-specific restriction protein B